MLPTVAGTPQAQEALISNSIPQTATVPLKNGPKFTPSFDGPPQYSPIEGTALTYVANAAEPLIRVNADAYYAVKAGVWFTAPQLTGPWAIATSVPASIYTIPPSSPIYYVTYVRIYEATPTVVYVGYTPGYLGTVVSPYGTVVYGTGYAYTPWVGSVWYPAPYTYGIAAAPVYNPYVGYTFGFALGLATAAWMEPYWGWGAYCPPAYWGYGYHCCASASANVYGHWGSDDLFGHAQLVRRRRRRRQQRAWHLLQLTHRHRRQLFGRLASTTPGPATPRAAMTAPATAPTAVRATWHGAATTTPTPGSARRRIRRRWKGGGGSTYNRAGTTTAGPQGDAHAGGGSSYNAHTGNTNPLGQCQRRQRPRLPTSTATSITTTATAGSSILPAAGARPAGDTVVGRSRIAGAQRRWRPLWRLLGSAGAASAAGAVSAAIASAGAASVAALAAGDLGT